MLENKVTSQLDARLSEFHMDLDRAERLLDLLSQFRVFGASNQARASDGDATAWKEAADLATIAQSVRSDLPILSGALHMYVSGRFEFFVRDIVVAVADSLSAAATTYADLPEKLRVELRELTLIIAQNPARYGYKDDQAENLLISLAANLEGKQGISLQSEVLAVTESNMHPGMLADIMKRVGIQAVWPEVGKQARLKAHLETRVDGECTKEAQSRLSAIMRDRNSFAHPTSSTEFPDVEQVRTTCGFLRALSEVLVDVAKLPQ